MPYCSSQPTLGAPDFVSDPSIIPYVVGQWVRGDRFYGRQAHLQEILEGPRESLWLLGTRRIGKTSLLRQLEWIASRNPDLWLAPLSPEEGATLVRVGRAIFGERPTE